MSGSTVCEVCAHFGFGPAVRCTICRCVHAACVYNNENPRTRMPLDVTSDAWKKTWQVAAVHTLACILPRCWAPRAPILAPPRGTCAGTPPLAPRERRSQRMMEVRRVANDF